HELAGAALEQHVGETAVAGAPLDFDDRRPGVLIGHDNRGEEPRVARVPAVELEFVGGERHGSRELVVLVALPGRRKRVHDRIFDRVEIEVLLAHEFEIARRQAAAGRPAVAARGERLALGIGEALEEALARAGAEGLDVLPPALAEIRLEVLDRALGMDVDVGDLEAHFLSDVGLAQFDVHQPASFYLVGWAKARKARSSRALGLAPCPPATTPGLSRSAGGHGAPRPCPPRACPRPTRGVLRPTRTARQRLVAQ